MSDDPLESLILAAVSQALKNIKESDPAAWNAASATYRAVRNTNGHASEPFEWTGPLMEAWTKARPPQTMGLIMNRARETGAVCIVCGAQGPFNRSQNLACSDHRDLVKLAHAADVLMGRPRRFTKHWQEQTDRNLPVSDRPFLSAVRREKPGVVVADVLEDIRSGAMADIALHQDMLTPRQRKEFGFDE